MSTVSIDIQGALAVLTISNGKVNPLSSVVMNDLQEAAKTVEANDSVRVVAVTGAGKAFVAGADISQMVEMTPAQAQAFAEHGGRLGDAIETSSKIWVAAVNGVALGGGCELALACDFIYAADKAVFGQPEVKLAVIPGFGGTQRLARRVGVAKAKELCVTGEQVTAEEALRIGLADQVFPLEQLLDKVKELAAKIAANGPLAVAAAKRVIHQGQSMTLRESLALEQRAFGELFATADQREGMGAFLAKRPTQFTGK